MGACRCDLGAGPLRVSGTARERRVSSGDLRTLVRCQTQARGLFLRFFGCGVGVILGGQPHRGRGGFSGEFGSIPLGDRRRKTETTGFHTSSAELFRRLSAAGKETDFGDLGNLYSAGDETVAAWLEAAADVFAPVIVSTEYLLDPEAVVFGGRLLSNLADALVAKIGERLPGYQHETKPYQPLLPRGATGKDAAALGVAAVPIYRALAPDPTSARSDLTL